MAKPLVLQIDGTDFPFEMSRVERADLYGYVETEALDAKGRRCVSATLCDDGQTIVASGGSSFASMSPDGAWLEKSQLKAVDPAGNEIKPVPSSYSGPVPVTKTATIDEFLAHNIRSVYAVTCQVDAAPLMEKLKSGTIFTFPYSFRGGLEPDTAFLFLAADGTPFVAIGTPTKLDFVGFDQPASTEEELDAENEDLDFGMM